MSLFVEYLFPKEKKTLKMRSNQPEFCFVMLRSQMFSHGTWQKLIICEERLSRQK